MLLNHPLPLSYTETPLDAFPDGYNDFDAEILPHVLRMRQRLLDAAADDSLPIMARVGRILILSAEIERDTRRRRIDRLAVSVEASPRGSARPRRGVAERLGARLLSVCYGFEYLVPAHREELALAHRTLHARAVRSLYAERRAAFLSHLSGREHEYEKWLSHTLRRYFPDAAETRRPLAEAKRTAATLLVILELGMSRFVRTGAFTVEDQAEILRVFSREYEHSTENPSLLATALGNPLFSLGRFLSALAE